MKISLVHTTHFRTKIHTVCHSTKPQMYINSNMPWCQDHTHDHAHYWLDVDWMLSELPTRSMRSLVACDDWLIDSNSNAPVLGDVGNPKVGTWRMSLAWALRSCDMLRLGWMLPLGAPRWPERPSFGGERISPIKLRGRGGEVGREGEKRGKEVKQNQQKWRTHTHTQIIM